VKISVERYYRTSGMRRLEHALRQGHWYYFDEVCQLSRVNLSILQPALSCESSRTDALPVSTCHLFLWSGRIPLEDRTRQAILKDMTVIISLKHAY
jgi:hypothetical protein